jgi:hypothetical protein
MPTLLYTGVRMRGQADAGPLPPKESDLGLPFIETQLLVHAEDPIGKSWQEKKECMHAWGWGWSTSVLEAGRGEQEVVWACSSVDHAVAGKSDDSKAAPGSPLPAACAAALGCGGVYAMQGPWWLHTCSSAV